VLWLVFCLLVLVCNVGIISEFKGFLFYIQVSTLLKQSPGSAWKCNTFLLFLNKYVFLK